MPERVEIYKDSSGAWRWVRIAGNNERIMSSTEGYANKGHAVEQAKEFNPDVELVERSDQNE